MPSRFIAEVNETAPLFNSVYEGDMPLTAEQLHARHHKDRAEARARAEAEAREAARKNPED